MFCQQAIQPHRTFSTIIPTASHICISEIWDQCIIYEHEWTNARAQNSKSPARYEAGSNSQTTQSICMSNEIDMIRLECVFVTSKRTALRKIFNSKMAKWYFQRSTVFGRCHNFQWQPAHWGCRVTPICPVIHRNAIKYATACFKLEFSSLKIKANLFRVTSRFLICILCWNFRIR